MEKISAVGFIVHAYRDARRERINILGRLSDGRSFAATFPLPELLLCVRDSDRLRVGEIVARKKTSVSVEDSAYRLFDGSVCARIACANRNEHERFSRMLKAESIESFGGDMKDAVAFLVRKGIRGGIRISGEWREGKGASVVFIDPEIEAFHGARAPLSVLSLDIETEEPAGIIRAIGLSQETALPQFADSSSGEVPGRSRCLLFNGFWTVQETPDREILIFDGERPLLEAFIQKIRSFDPDIITGWNIIDFDFPRLAAAFARHGLDFTLGRSIEGGRFFPAETVSDGAGGSAKRSASVFLPGRQVLDALRLVRTGYESFESYTLDAVARQILGKGKTVTVSDGEKLAELDRLYAEDPANFCRYCLHDADLVLDILSKRGVIAHTVERAALTGAGIDKAWTSVASFERVYAEGLYAKKILEPNPDPSRRVSGAAGGTVLDPLAGVFSDIAVFDFRSLYPSIIRTFNIDPLAHEVALAAQTAAPGQDFIRAPNGTLFVRERGILPCLIDEYFTARLSAIARGDDASAFVYKILMNSFYGVLGTPKCRYARTELAGAITSFGKVCLLFARDFFRGKGFRVLYGDTDSVFVEMPGMEQDAPEGGFKIRCETMATELNESLAQKIADEYRCESFIGIRFEKRYRRFYIPRLRSDEEDAERGRAKGYAGLLVHEDGSTEVEIKGMEAARSDYTPFAQRFQRELLGLLFREPDTVGAERFIREQTIALYRGTFDAELVFRKKLRREPESYTASTPPHIKVARSLGWSHRRGTVEYLMTVNGPEALSMLRSPVDHSWYVSSQLLPVARSAGLAAGFDADVIVRSVHSDGQLELNFPA
jgi:DNA polymerase-2